MNAFDHERDVVGGWVDDYEKNGDFGDELKWLDNDVRDMEDELYQDFEDEMDVRELWKQSDSLFQFFIVFRWLLNLVTIGFPWVFISQIFFAWNVLFNAKWNFLWAGGNVYLVGNTIYAYITTWLSVFVVWEMPIYMTRCKLIRFISFVAAIVYNFLYFSSCADFWALLFYYDKDKFDIFYLMEAMFFGYNIVLHFPITIVNGMIIIKEIMLEMFQMSAKRHGHNYNLALGMYEILDFWSTVFKVANPMTYLKFVRAELYNKLYKKYVMHQPIQKKRY